MKLMVEVKAGLSRLVQLGLFKRFPSVRQRLTVVASSTWLWTLLALFVAESLFLSINTNGIRVAGPVIPLAFGLIKDLVDVVIVVLFPWHGWVFVAPLLVLLILEPEIKKLMTLFLLSTTTTALISSFFNFGNFSLKKFATGIFTYAAINLFVLLFLLLLKSTINGVLKCRR